MGPILGHLKAEMSQMFTQSSIWQVVTYAEGGDMKIRGKGTPKCGREELF